MERTGHNDTTIEQSIGQFLVPSWLEIVLYLIASLILLSLANLHLLWQTITSSAQLSQTVVNQALQPSFDQLTQALDNTFLSQVVVFTVWGFVGCLAYMLTWGVQHAIGQARQDIDQSTYIQPTGSKHYWESKAAHYVLAVSAIFVFATGLLGFLLILWPSAISLFGATIRHYQQPKTYWSALEAVALVSVSLYVLRRLWQAARYAVKIAA